MRLYEEDFYREKRAFEQDPKKWIGWQNDPKNPEYQRRREMSNKVFDKILKKIEHEKK